MKFLKKTRDAGLVDKNTPAGRIVARFGGLANMSEITGIPSSTIWGWIKRGDIPQRRIPEIKWFARENKIRIADKDYVRPIADTAFEEEEAAQ